MYDQNGGFYSTTKVYGYIKYQSVNESYKFWMGLLNSRLFWFFIQQTGYVLRGGYFTFKTNYILPFPVPSSIPENVVSQVEHLVSDILVAKKKSDSSDVSEKEKQIDKIIYDLYNLSEDETKVIDSMNN